MASGGELGQTNSSHNSKSTSNSLEVKPFPNKKRISWELPPSKSHAIRTLFLASQSSGSTEIFGINNSGHDVNSMKNCLIHLGVKMEKLDNHGNVSPLGIELIGGDISSIIVHGVGKNGFKKPEKRLDIGNSGTTLRLISILCSRFDFEVIIDGDMSIRSRYTKSLWDSMVDSGVSVSYLQDEFHLPVKIQGPWFSQGQNKTLLLDISKSSQPLSAWILSSSALEDEIEIEFDGIPVSNRHWELSLEMCNSNGAEIVLNENSLIIKPWVLDLKPKIEIPKDASMASFAMLAASCLDIPIDLIGWPKREDCVGHEVLFDISESLGIRWNNSTLTKFSDGNPVNVDITNCNDIITPLSLMLALASGGKISGALHTSFKESNRLKSTKLLLDCFGMECDLLEDGLFVNGNQIPKNPDNLVKTFGDHRVFMSAYILGCFAGAIIDGNGLHKIADERFIERISKLY